MSTFRDRMAADLDVFFSQDAFGEVHRINGRMMPAILDGAELLARKDARAKHLDGIYTGELLVYVRASVYGPQPPAPGSVFTVDDKRYKVVSATAEDGVYAISLEANRL